MKDEVLENNEDRELIPRYTPLGVVVGIVPWNFPVMLCLIKIAPALLTGNTIIVKPSPYTPYCALKLAEIGQKFFPPGVLQTLSGDDNLGPWLTAHPGPAKISFTGSGATGGKVMESASKPLKRVTLELYVRVHVLLFVVEMCIRLNSFYHYRGGNDPAIICPDINIEAVAAKVCISMPNSTWQAVFANWQPLGRAGGILQFRTGMYFGTI